MNTATKSLEDDHIHILKLTDVMEKITQAADARVEHLESIVDIIRNFADGIHHAKEEDLLFPLLGEKGFSPEQGPVAVMLNEHTAGRNFVKQISVNIARYKTGDKKALVNIFEAMEGYTSLLRAHISKENNVLFRMADRFLTEEEQTDLLQKFSMTEEKHTPSKTYIDKISELARYYNL